MNVCVSWGLVHCNGNMLYFVSITFECKIWFIVLIKVIRRRDIMILSRIRWVPLDVAMLRISSCDQDTPHKNNTLLFIDFIFYEIRVAISCSNDLPSAATATLK